MTIVMITPNETWIFKQNAPKSWDRYTKTIVIFTIHIQKWSVKSEFKICLILVEYRL